MPTRFLGYVDVANALQISGWAWDGANNQPAAVTIVCPDDTRLRLAANQPRPDVVNVNPAIGVACGWGFSPSLRPGYEGDYEVLFEDNTTVPNGSVQVRASEVRNHVEHRWKGDEPPEGLTWGHQMTGDSVVDAMTRHRIIDGNPRRYLEIGPGYGRILRTMLERNVPIARYVGIELSAARTERLNAELGSAAIGFHCGSCETASLSEQFDAVFCSATFEHLHPDCRRALLNLRRHLVPGGRVYIDFVIRDEEGKTRSAVFETQAFVRIYSLDELHEIFPSCGIRVDAIDRILLGVGDRGDGTPVQIRRFAVIGTRT